MQNLKGNEFWIIGKLLARTLVKLFQLQCLPKAWRSLTRATLIRKLFQQQLGFNDEEKVQVLPKAKNPWLLRRLLAKLKRINRAPIP